MSYLETLEMVRGDLARYYELLIMHPPFGSDRFVGIREKIEKRSPDPPLADEGPVSAKGGQAALEERRGEEE